ncbi:phosphatidylserine decarboxylase [Thiorhodococcus minor]|uniref:Phosphatidylserine decarboxylase n=1 Tax=Thiorhodococcus minor TaxID=57489 RepID=A0A6M0JUV8_9GAMM|nr:phosphatidylserine decarboxylase [Thiorhodococcus minor]NEV60949.1 phosphatidylserine decarboxylase [Thiorhodococcus minor]
MKPGPRLEAALLLVAVLWSGWGVAAADSPCQGAIDQLLATYEEDAAFRALTDRALANVQPMPDTTGPNPWQGRDIHAMADFFARWCTFLPEVSGSHDDGLRYIKEFAQFYYRNEYGVAFVQQSPGREITQGFVRERGAFMDSAASAAKVAEWLADPRIEREDYQLPDPTRADGGFTSFNDFFARTLKDQAASRPQTLPERDYVIAAPTDCIMNTVPQRITDLQAEIPTKFNAALNIVELLGGSRYAERFVGGTALSCVLMPNTYHHYHAPVSGQVVEARLVGGAFFGYDNFPAWVPANGDVGAHGTELSQFEDFQRGYFIIDTGSYGHVALVAVGLNTISSVVFTDKLKSLSAPVSITRGDELGHFLYGGSLFIMIFEPGRYSSGAVKVRLGNQIGVFETPGD